MNVAMHTAQSKLSAAMLCEDAALGTGVAGAAAVLLGVAGFTARNDTPRARLACASAVTFSYCPGARDMVG